MNKYANPYAPYGDMLVMAVNAGKNIKLISPSNLDTTLTRQEEKENFKTMAIFCAQFYSKVCGKGEFSGEFFRVYEALALVSFNPPQITGNYSAALGFLEAYCQSHSRLNNQELITQLQNEWSNIEDSLHGPPQTLDVSQESMKIMELGFAVIPLSLQFCPDKSGVDNVNQFAKKIARALVNAHALANDNTLAVIITAFTVLRLSIKTSK